MQELEKILEEKIDEAIKRYGNNPYIDEKVADICYGINIAKDIIRKHMNDGWIPVQERMPEDGTYLCTLKGELCGIKEPFTGMCGIENGIWDEPGYVIAWKPLPEPYRPNIQEKPEDRYPEWRAKFLNKFDRRE